MAPSPKKSKKTQVEDKIFAKNKFANMEALEMEVYSLTGQTRKTYKGIIAGLHRAIIEAIGNIIFFDERIYIFLATKYWFLNNDNG